MKRLPLIPAVVGLIAGAIAYWPVRLARLRPSVDVEQADWSFTPGRTARVDIGPIALGVNTADGAGIGFGISVGRWDGGWHLGFERREDPR